MECFARGSVFACLLIVAAGFLSSCGSSSPAAVGVNTGGGTSFSVTWIGSCDAPTKGECYFFDPTSYYGTASNYNFSGTVDVYSAVSQASLCTGTRTNFSTGTGTGTSTGSGTSTAASTSTGTGINLCPPGTNHVESCVGVYAGHCISKYSGSSNEGIMVDTSTDTWVSP